MDRAERFYKIVQLLHDRRSVPLTTFLEHMEVSRATFKRDIEYLRDRYQAPIAWDREAHGYKFTEQVKGAKKFELPGLWFNATEIYALLTMQHLLAGLQSQSVGQKLPHKRTAAAVRSSALCKAFHKADYAKSSIEVAALFWTRNRVCLSV